MTNEQLQRFVEQLGKMLNNANMTLMDEMFASNFVAHFPIAPRLNRKSYKLFIQGFYDAFPDLYVEINNAFMSGDQLAMRVTYYGTHLGDFMGIAATGRQIEMPGMCQFKIVDNLIAENWTEIDIFGLLRQISNLPPLDPNDNPPYLN